MGTVPMHPSSEGGDWATAVAGDIARVGVAAASGVVPPPVVAALGAALDRAVAEDATFLPPDRVAAELGRVVFLPTYGRPFLGLLDDGPLYEPVDAVIGAGGLLYTMTSSCIPPGGAGRALHRDSALLVPGIVPALGIMVLLDDFDEASGSTRFHPAVTERPPDPAEFEQSAMRLVAPAGSVCWFHGAAWHDATRNTTALPRRCIILAIALPFIRQRFDMPSMVAHLDPGDLSPGASRRLGLDAPPPGSYEEYYLPPDERAAAVLARARRGRGVQISG